MEIVLSIFAWLALHWQDVLAAVVAILTAVVGIAMLIPGDQPEKFLGAVVEFLKKFSRK